MQTLIMAEVLDEAQLTEEALDTEEALHTEGVLHTEGERDMLLEQVSAEVVADVCIINFSIHF